jgi:hypothetical protein
MQFWLYLPMVNVSAHTVSASKAEGNVSIYSFMSRGFVRSRRGLG